MSKVAAFSTMLVRSPLLWGGAASAAFFALIHGGVLTDATVIRYFAGHWVEYVEVVMFFVGLASLVIKAADVVWQRRGVHVDHLDPIPDGGQDPAEAADLLATLPGEGQPDSGSLLVRRLREAIDLVARTGDPDGLEDHLKYLSDVDAGRAAQGYGLVKFVVWAIPIMGFLGTVIGLTVAIANLSPTQLENISGVVAGLGTAFDTTATALGLSMVLMFVQFVVDRFEQGMLGEVDAVAWESLAGRFQSLSGAGGMSLAVARLGEAVGRSSEQLIEAQAQSWRKLEQTATKTLAGVLDGAGQSLRTSLEDSLRAALREWTDSLAKAHAGLVAEREERWAAAADSLATAIRALESRQEIVAGQTELLASVVHATRDLASLEKTLNDNLATVSSAGRLEEVLAALAASTQLLAARVGTGGPARRVELPMAGVAGKAA